MQKWNPDRFKTQLWNTNYTSNRIEYKRIEEGMATHSSILAVFLLGESYGQRSLVAAVLGVAKSQTGLKWLSMHTLKRVTFLILKSTKFKVIKKKDTETSTLRTFVPQRKLWVELSGRWNFVKNNFHCGKLSMERYPEKWTKSKNLSTGMSREIMERATQANGKMPSKKEHGEGGR